MPGGGESCETSVAVNGLSGEWGHRWRRSARPLHVGHITHQPLNTPLIICVFLSFDLTMQKLETVVIRTETTANCWVTEVLQYCWDEAEIRVNYRRHLSAIIHGHPCTVGRLSGWVIDEFRQGGVNLWYSNIENAIT